MALEFEFPETTDARLNALFDLVKEDVKNWLLSPRWRAMKKVHDQFEGGGPALSEEYHPKISGLSEKNEEIVRQMRSHVNLVEPALDRLVNSIHAGKISRKIRKGRKPIQRALARPEYGEALARLTESAFLYGTGYISPIWAEGGRLAWWFPSARYTALAVNPLDVYDTRGIVELVPATSALLSPGAAYSIRGIRFLTSEIDGSYDTQTKALTINEHNLGFLPLEVAYGRDRRHLGEKYGGSLVGPAADASIKVTDNTLQLELLRTRQTQALLVVMGEPDLTSAEAGEGGQGGEGLQKFIQFNKKDEGDAKFVTPESRLEQVIKVSERLMIDCAVSSGLPLDTFLPEKVTGTDASATAARNRAFPLQQRMIRLVGAHRTTEERVAAIVAGLEMRSRDQAVSRLDDLIEKLGIECQIQPSQPEAEAETLANWQQRTEKFFSRVEDAIEYYSPHLSDEDKALLARAWRERFENNLTRAEDAEKTKFLREAFLAFLGDGTVSDMLANLTRLGDLVESVDLPRNTDYEEPYAPVETSSGQLVSGETLKDSAGDVVGGTVVAQKTGTEGEDPVDRIDPIDDGGDPKQAAPNAPTNFGQRDAGELDPNNGAGRSGEVTK